MLRRDRRHHIGHAGVIAVAAVVLVLGKGLGEIVLALVGDARHVLLARQIGVVTGVAAVLLHQRLAALQPRRLAGLRGRRRGLRYLGDEIREEAKIVVGQRLRHLVHRLEGAQLFAEHEELDQRVRRLLPAERGRVLGLGLALFAVTGEARHDALLDGLGVGGKGDGGERQSQDLFSHRGILWNRTRHARPCAGHPRLN